MTISTPEGDFNGRPAFFQSEVFGLMRGFACLTRLSYLSWPVLSSTWRLELRGGGGVMRRATPTPPNLDSGPTWSISWDSYEYGFSDGATRRWRRYLLPQTLLARIIQRRITKELQPSRRICVALEPSDEATAASELLVVEDLESDPIVERVVDRRTGRPWSEVPVALAKELQLNSLGSMPWPSDGESRITEEQIRARFRPGDGGVFFPERPGCHKEAHGHVRPEPEQPGCSEAGVDANREDRLDHGGQHGGAKHTFVDGEHYNETESLPRGGCRPPSES